MSFKITEYIPRRVCRDDLLKRLGKAGFDTTGYDRSLEKILLSKDFGLPVKEEEDEYHFMINYKYTRICLTYTDALAEEILLLHDLKMI